MERSLEQIISDAKAKSFDERARRIKGSYRFEVRGKGTYRLEVDDGRWQFREDGGPADCEITLDADDFVRMAEGQLNLLTAYMQGCLQLEGNLALAKQLHGALGAVHEGAQP